MANHARCMGASRAPCYTLGNWHHVDTQASHNMNVFMLGLISGLLLWPVIGPAELYKWTDDRGNIYITDTPPPATQKKSAITVAPAPRSALPKKATVRPTLPGRFQAEVHPVPVPLSPPVNEERLSQRPLEGLSPSQATLTSSWRVFDSAQMNAKAPVQRWKDEQGLDHFVDVLPAILSRSEVTPKFENVSASPSTHRAKERTTGVSGSRHQSAE